MATWWIRQSIDRAIKDQGDAIRIPIYVAEHIRKIAQAREQLAEERGYRLTNQELSETSGLSMREVETTVQVIRLNPISLSTAIGEEDDTLADCIADTSIINPEDEAIDTSLKEEVDLLLSGWLSAREKLVIKLRYGIDSYIHTLDSVGVELGITRERVRQIEEGALRKLRTHSVELRGYLC
jgi:RNA polymerase primary sigma factor